jgi:phage terminase small subunit
MDFLSEKGLLVLNALQKHCREKLKTFDVDEHELAMLAKSFELYAKHAKYCLDNGETFEMETKTGTYPMVRPEYTIMNKEYQNILKHGAKFGLNPGDREKIFKGLSSEKEKKKGFDLTPMKVAK